MMFSKFEFVNPVNGIFIQVGKIGINIYYSYLMLADLAYQNGTVQDKVYDYKSIFLET